MGAGAAADAEDVVLVPILTNEQRQSVAELVREADKIENADPEYRAELEQWTTAMGKRSDGVSARSFPLATAHRGEVPLRDFGTAVSGQMPPVNGLRRGSVSDGARYPRR